MAEPDTAGGGKSFFGPEDLVSASELREFIFCERAWFLARQGHPVSATQAQEQRAAGVTFHVERAGAARRASSNQHLWWAIILIFAAFALWLLKSLMGIG